MHKIVSKKIKHLINNSFFSGRSIALLLIFLLGIKQRAIYSIYGGQITGGILNTALLSLGFLGNDLMILGIVLLLVFVNLNFKHKTIKRIINSINIILILIFFIDIVTILFFQSRLSIFDMYSFFSVSSSKYFFSYSMFALLFFWGLFILAFVLSQKFLKKRKESSHQRIIALIFFGITVAITGINVITRNNTTIANNILSLNIQTFEEWINNKKAFNISSSKKYEEYFTTIKGKNRKPNIILLFAESLSTIDSKRSGWLYDNLPLFDKIQSEGITFTNFIANGCTSETAHIATLQWIEPREYPRIDSNQDYDAYANYLQSLPEFMQDQGYKTTFISTVTLDFLNQKAFLSGLRYQNIIWEEAFKKEKKYVFNAAPDQALYNKALDVISWATTPVFLTLQSVSSHRPYDTPYGQDTEQMFSYVDKSLYTFYQKLKNSWFFDNGILVIVGDHRKMEAINKAEFERFGLSSKSRVIATVVGNGIKKDTFNDNIIQHTDIHNSLKYLVAKENVQISKLFNNAFSLQANRDWGIRYCRFAEKIYVKINKDGSASNVTEKKEDNVIRQYIEAYKGFQAEKLLWIKWIANYDTPKISENNATWFVLIAHGWWTYKKRLPNTINTAKRANKDGANALELDVSFTKDNQNIVIHGPSLQTTACGPNKTTTWFTLKEIKDDCPLRNGEKILTLEEFLTKTKDLFDLYFLEIKVYDNTKAEAQTLDAINTITKLGLEDKVIFISYDRIANYIIWSHKKIRAGWDSFAEESDLIYQFPHEFYLVPESMLNRNTIEVAQAMKKTFVVYTLNTQESIKKALSLGAKYIMTDNIPLVKAVIKTQSKQDWF